MTDHIALNALKTAMYRAAEAQDATSANIYAAAPPLRRAAFALNRLNEAECNGVPRYNSRLGIVESQWTDEDQARSDRLRVRNEDRARAALAVAFGADWALHFDLEFQGDPRGAPIKLHPAGNRGGRDLVSVW